MFAAWSQSDSKQQQHGNDKEMHNLLLSSSVGVWEVAKA